MTIDFSGLLYEPIHDIFGVEAVITPVTSASPATLIVIDKTSGVPVPRAGQRFAGDPDVDTLGPAAVVRVTALTDAGLTRADLRRASLTMNGQTYRIESTVPRSTPGGEADGEVYLMLSEG
jgi:hypothetical protein